MEPRLYDPGSHFFSWKGIPLLGAADGDYYEGEMAENAYEEYIGAFGEVAVVVNRNEFGLFTARIQATHPTNDLLTAAYYLGRNGGGFTGALFGKDGVGTTVVDAPVAWIKKLPQVSFAKEQPVREWVFGCAKLTLFVGGGVAAV